MHVVLYWLARLALFVAVLLALAVVGWFDVVSVIAALVVAWLLSYLALGQMRARAMAQMDGWLTRARTSHHADDAAEDAEVGGPDER